MQKTKILTYAGIGSAALLAGLPAFLTLASMFGVSEAKADEPRTIGAAATVVPNLSLAADNLSIMMTPTGSGSVFKTGSIDATVSTNNETGYTLYFSDKDLDTSLKHKNLTGQAIVSTASAATGTEMLANTWGYTLSENVVAEGESESNNATNLALTYKSIPVDYTAIKTTESQTSGDVSKLTFGVKIDNSIPSGVYSDEVLISAVINYSSMGYDQSRLWLNKDGVQITTMQEMTYDICEAVPTPTVTATGTNVPEITLTDTRDGKSYKVRKLADGNCWMVESLAIENAAIEPTKSNVTTSFNLSSAVASSETTGKYDEAVIANDGGNDTYLYNWFAATAGSGTTSVTNGQSAPQDICPKGWQLPNKDGNLSWDKLLRVGQGVYEVATSDSNYHPATKVSWGKYDENGVGLKIATGNPLGLQVTGNLYKSAVDLKTTHGFYWTRTSSSGLYNAYHFHFHGTAVAPYITNLKSVGRAVRCVAQGTGAVTPANATYMQDVEACPSSLPLERKYTLKDKRDEKEYAVARLADGNCWMTSSLALENKTLTPADSNVTEDFNLSAALPATTTGLSNTSMEQRVISGGVNDTMLYNWFAATAGTGTATMVNESAPSDICPKGWQLPNNNGDKSWNKLLRDGQGVYQIATSSNGYTNAKVDWGTYAGISTASANPLGLQLTGDFWDSKLEYTGSGLYWTRTAYSNAANAYNLGFKSDGVYPQGDDRKGVGCGVRCVLK